MSDLVRPTAAVLIIFFCAAGWQVARGGGEAEGGIIEGDLTVMTYNIQSGFSRDNVWDLEAIAQVIEEEDPDIVLLQEVSRGWLVTASNDQYVWLADRLDMEGVWGPASDDEIWGNAILTRGAIPSNFLIEYDSTQNLQRSAVGGLIESEYGLVTTVATHLDNPSTAGAERDGQLDQLFGAWDETSPTIIGGDFNATPDDPLIQRIRDSGLTDAGEALPEDEAWTSEDRRRIDYIFVSDHFEVGDVRVIDTDASDHRPVVVELQLAEPEMAP